jgi:preprotein translocase subunit SecF
MKYLLKHKNAIVIFSTILVIAGVSSVLIFGFRLGIDFTSGSLWQMRIQDTNATQLRDFFTDKLGVGQVNISYDSANSVYAVSLEQITENQRQEYLGELKSNFQGVESLDFSTISPSVSTELRHKSMLAIVFVLVGISLYIAFAFRKVSEPIKSWKYGVITLITLFHDVSIPAGVFAILGHTIGLAIDTNFIVALLFVMGFSVHDTIVVFDRIRENLLITIKEKRAIVLSEVVDKSIMETLARSINTSLTLIFILITLFFLGPISIKYFVLTILIGTIAGTYSSIFFASPLLLLAERLSRNSHK